MGGTFYSHDSRSLRAASAGYSTKSVSEIFTQQKERKIHKEMDPKNFKIREARDSEAHPATIPIILGLDVTGSMGHIPHDLIKEGLPKLMGDLIQKGAKDAAVCFVAVGDHENDSYPLQAGQFESGDAELDMWLTRTYLEGGGGGNAGESYLLAWYFAARRTIIDSMVKRGKKGFLFTIGDEPNLESLPASAIKEVTGDEAQKTFSADDLLREAQESYNVYHIEVSRNDKEGKSRARQQWKQKLGKNCVFVDDYTKVPEVIAEIVLQNSGIDLSAHRVPVDDEHIHTDGEGEEKIIL